MTHSSLAPKPQSPFLIPSTRPAYPSCPIDLRSAALTCSGPTWEELLGQR